MTVAGSAVGRRYELQDLDGREGAAERWVGYDERLGRPVVVWTIEGDEADPEREQLLAVARSVARGPQPVFLRILDIVPEREQLAIVLEMPEAPPEAAPPRLRALAAARAVLELAEAIDAAEVAGVALARLSPDYLHRGEDGGVRADPVGLFLPGRSRGEPSAAPLVDLLAAVLERRAPMQSSAHDHAADEQLRALIQRWERRDGDLTMLIEELREITGVPVGAPAPAPARAARGAVEETARLAPWPPATAPARPRPARRRRPEREVRWNVAVPAAAAVLAIVLGLAGLVVASQIGLNPSRLAPGGEDGSGPPVSQPAADRVTVGLRAQEETGLRVTVDGVVEFDGILRAGERQLWEGNERIQVWTNRGQTLLLSVNGHDLGPYAPAMGARDNDAEVAGWNRIDYGFWPGWAP